MQSKRRRTIVVSSEDDSDGDDVSGEASFWTLGEMTHFNSCFPRRDEEDGGGCDDSDAEEEHEEDSFIAPSDEEEGGGCDDSDGEEGHEEDSEEEYEEEGEEEGDVYVCKEDMRKAYEKDPGMGEPAGYIDSMEHTTQLSPEETWRRITNMLGTEAGRKEFGLVAQEHGDVRVVKRFDYGSDRDKSVWNKAYDKAGSYEKILVPTIELMFDQKAYQPPPDGKNIPSYAFSGWENIVDYRDATEEVTDEIDTSDLWCICCQNSRDKEGGLKHIQILQHLKSGVYIATGGDCARHMLAERSREDAAARCRTCDSHDMRKLFRRIMCNGRDV